MGKTVVAQGVIRELMNEERKRKNAPLVVFYVCSSLAIAAQNRRKLLEILPVEERHQAVCPVDRLTLIGIRDPPRHEALNLYTLTPDTSLPLREGRSRKGQQAERALLYALVKSCAPEILKVFSQDDFRQKTVPAREDEAWKKLVKDYKKNIRISPRLCRDFKKALRGEFELKDGQWLRKAIDPLRGDRLKFIAKMRNALAACNLNRIKPDLVIFDEFQRFQDLVQEQQERLPSRVERILRGENVSDPPALLLLSATPYKPYARRWEEADGLDPRSGLLDLVQFILGGKGNPAAARKRKICEEAFRDLEKELRLRRINSPDFLSAKQRIEGILRPVMSRVEKLAHSDGLRAIKLRHESTDLHSNDLRAYKEMASTYQGRDRPWIVPYWSSIPLPGQTMGQYLAWKRRDASKSHGAPTLTEDHRNGFSRPKEWPHPRLRQLESMAGPEKLILPWVAPSLPWWKLRGLWRPDRSSGGPSKLLVFSRYRAVPPTVAALLSYSLECKYRGQRTADKDTDRQARKIYEAAPSRKVLQARPKREALLALFHPSPWVVMHTEPLAARSSVLPAIRKELERQLKAALAEVGVGIGGETKRPLWRLLVGIERQAKTWRYSHLAWHQLGMALRQSDDTESALAALVSQWSEEFRQSELTEISRIELERLVDYALSAPGVVMGRALRRHWPEAVGESGFKETLEAVWRGLRTYLDYPWFVRALGGGQSHYPESLKRAVVDGNLESVLDEHLWIATRIQGVSGSALARELRTVLSLRSSNFSLQPVNGDGAPFTLRCHAALPFTEARAVAQGDEKTPDKPLRPDELRKAFNSPFWPHVLATTSVGQEGLDFHSWCSCLVHWDLAPDPVAHEQRQGRIQRYGGLSIRAALANKLGEDVLSDLLAHRSPWAELAARAEREPSFQDELGLKPWWILPGAEVENVIFQVPASEQQVRWKQLQDQVRHYRIALGHPNQEDLLEYLRGVPGLTDEQVRAAFLDLSPAGTPKTGQ